MARLLDSPFSGLAIVFIFLAIILNFISLLVSFYIYDLSSLYKLSWLDNIPVGRSVVCINAGFDETTDLLKAKYPQSTFRIFDFYDPAKHTEVSIKRARKAYPPVKGTEQIGTTTLPLQDRSTDSVFAILSAHEIRNSEERIIFFKELNRVLVADGRVIITEHLRDLPNFLAYNIGFLHFHSRATWYHTFEQAGLTVEGEIKITAFVTTFILIKNGTTS